jgi:hypothetical protein
MIGLIVALFIICRVNKQVEIHVLIWDKFSKQIKISHSQGLNPLEDS